MGIQSIETISLCSILNSSTHGLHKFKCIAATPSLTFGFGRLYIQCGARFRPCIDIHKYVFNNGKMDLERLKDLVCVVGKQKLVLDLSCRKKDVRYVIVTDRWQKFSDVYLCKEVPDFLANYADEFLVHGVDFEEKRLGIDEELVALLGKIQSYSHRTIIG